MKAATRSYLGILAARTLFAFILSLICFGVISLIGQHFAKAVEAHTAHPSSTSISSSRATLLVTLGNNKRLASHKKNTPLPSPTIIDGQWYCQPPYIVSTKQLSKAADGTIGFSEDCVLNDLSFPCSDRRGPNGHVEPNERVIKQDWLSGNSSPGSALQNTGHFMYTYPNDTYKLPQVTTLFGYLESLSFFLIVPSILLMAYNLLLGAATFRYAGSLEGLSRVALGGLAVGVSFTLVQMMINLENTMATAIVQLHMEFPFPQTPINGIPIAYRLSTESSKTYASSYRGLVMPMSRWGCAANDFIGIFAPQFISDTLGSVLPIAGNLAHLGGNVKTLSDLMHRTGEMTMMVLSILLWVQVFVRIVTLNYYILMAPLSFSCWAMPGGTGQRIVALWFKGFISILFVQVLQVFILTTLPLILPTLPQISSDSAGIMQGFLVEVPPILALYVTLMAPTLIGVTASKVLGTASSMAGQTIVLLGTAASQII